VVGTLTFGFKIRSVLIFDVKHLLRDLHHFFQMMAGCGVKFGPSIEWGQGHKGLKYSFLHLDIFYAFVPLYDASKCS
jgi:hypothetical protein